MNHPHLLFSDKKGKIHRHPFLKMAVSSLNLFKKPKENDLIKIPEGSSLFYLPNRIPVGFNEKTGEFTPLFEFEGNPVFAVAAFIIPAYLRLYNPAIVKSGEGRLPLWAYAACGVVGSNVYVAAARIDRRIRQSPHFYNGSIIRKQVKRFLKSYPQNRLVRHLSNCALNYNCLAAKNFFLKRWEAPMPTSRVCNARCIGCLSYQESDCEASHNRISFKPSVSELYEVMYNHLTSAREAIASFGQGCEGEPLFYADTIAEAISKVRENTACGTINMNTNASMPGKIDLLCRAGIDSFRVSLSSPQEKFYNRYFRPLNYKFSDVLRSIETAKKHNKFVSVNLFIFPGFSDSKEEIKALLKFIKNTGVDMLQMRNLNIDPDFYFEVLRSRDFTPQGVTALVNILNKEFPRLKIGYFNLPKEKFKNFENMVILNKR
ncbi:MAG: radical SAM protein [Candidatus Omnitrophica bacterium]|nr:radical SAM protein [Candidatus Omnitrophota bacterium]